MNNSEKAKEIANKRNILGRYTMDEIEKSCLEMAQWKDKQLNNLKDEIQSNLCASSGFNDEYSRGYQDCGIKVIEMIDKILKNV